MVTGFALLAGIAAAREFDPGSEPMLVASLVHQGGDDTPWGVEVGAALGFALGDNCSWAEGDCHASQWWPTAGPRVAATWRGRDRFGLDIEALAGVGLLDAHQFGYFPIFEADASVGAAFERGAPPAFTLGGRASKSLSYNAPIEVAGGTGYRTYGLPFVAATFGAEERLSRLPRDARWTSGLQMSPIAADYE